MSVTWIDDPLFEWHVLFDRNVDAIPFATGDLLVDGNDQPYSVQGGALVIFGADVVTGPGLGYQLEHLPQVTLQSGTTV